MGLCSSTVGPVGPGGPVDPVDVAMVKRSSNETGQKEEFEDECGDATMLISRKFEMHSGE